ncbi:MAG: hypothetical protein U0L73_13020 [Ruminococcus bromii]|nr:hypothetical protein [Ruminococcus bromii]
MATKKPKKIKTNKTAYNILKNMLGQYVITTETSLPTLTTNPRYYGAIDPMVMYSTLREHPS